MADQQAHQDRPYWMPQRWDAEARAALQELQAAGVQAAFEAAVGAVDIGGVGLHVDRAVTRREPGEQHDTLYSSDGREYDGAVQGGVLVARDARDRFPCSAQVFVE